MSTALNYHCSSFQAHVWKPNICANCKGTKEQHTSSLKEKDELVTTSDKSGSTKEKTVSKKTSSSKETISTKSSLSKESSTFDKRAVTKNQRVTSEGKDTNADEKRRKVTKKVPHSSSKDSITSEKGRITKDTKEQSVNDGRKTVTKTVSRKTPPRTTTEAAKGSGKAGARTASKPTAKHGSHEKPIKSPVRGGGGGVTAKHAAKPANKSAQKATTNIDGKSTNKAAVTSRSNAAMGRSQRSEGTSRPDNRYEQTNGGGSGGKQISRNASIDSLQSSSSSYSAHSADSKHRKQGGCTNGAVSGATSVEAAIKTLSSGSAAINKGASSPQAAKYSPTCSQRNEATDKISRTTMSYSGLTSGARTAESAAKTSVSTQNTGNTSKTGSSTGKSTDNVENTVMNTSSATSTTRDNNNTRTGGGQTAVVNASSHNNNPVATRNNAPAPKSTALTDGPTRAKPSTASAHPIAASRANIPLDGKVSKFATAVSSPRDSAVNVNSAQHSVKTSASVSNKANTTASQEEKSAKSAVNKVANVGSGTTQVKIEKRKCIVDKGRLSTEKVILTDATIVTTCKTGDKSKSDKTKSDSKEKSGLAKDRKSKRSIFSSSKNARDTNNTAVSADKKEPIDSGNISAAKNKPGKVTINETPATKQPVARAMDSNTSNAVSNSNQPQPYNRSNSDKSVEDFGDGKGTVRRSRSRSNRPAAPPPQVPPNRLPSPTKAMSESLHISSTVDKDAALSMSPKRNSANFTGGGSDFSDLYSDILSTLSTNKDITPDILNKLKDDKAEDRSSHYYHKYDVTGTKKKPRDMTLSRALGDGTSSIIVETMNTSFHSSAGDDVSDVTTLELTMPYNIVDVSKVPPSKRSPRLPSTPAPEQSSRTSTLERSTLKNRKSAMADQSRRSESPAGSKKQDINGGQSDSVSMDGGLELDNSGMGLESVLQGLPPRYWHTYEPIEAKNVSDAEPLKSGSVKGANANSSAKITKSPAKSAKSASVETMLDTRDGDFVRRSAARATAPGRGFKSDCKPESSAKPSSPLPYLDLSKPASRSAENLLDSSPSSPDKKVKRSNSKRDKQSGGFFSRLFGFGRKTSTDDGSGEEKSPEETCSLQENAEFFKPLQIATGESSPVKEPSLSPPVLDKCDIVSDIERAIAKGQSNKKELSITIPEASPNITDTNKSKSAFSSEKQSDASSKPVPSPRTAFLYTNTQHSSPLKSPKTVSISPETSVDSSPAKRVSISPEGTMDMRLVKESLSQSSLLSDGSSDAKSISSREEQGSGDSQNLKQRRPRPKSQAVPRKMLDAPPPPPPVASPEKRRSVSEDTKSPRPTSTLATSLTSSQTSNKSSVSSKTGSPTTSPSKAPSNPFSSLKVTGKGKTKKGSPSGSEETCDKPLSPKKLEISAPIMLQSSTLNESQTLPRPVKKVSHNLITESRDDTHMATGRRKKIDSVAKHARNKTVTEGVNIDPELLGESSGSNGDVLTQRLNGHKYQNRALPPTPTQSPTPTRDSPDKKPRKSVTIQETSRDSYSAMNEDIYTDPIEEDDDDITSSKSISSRFKSSEQSRKSLSCGSSHDKIKSNRPVFSTLQPPVNLLADYLEPKESPETRPSFIKPLIAAKPTTQGNGVSNSTNGAPVLLPRNAVTSQSPKQNGGTDNYVSMIYVNTEMIIDKTRPPMDVGDGFRCMAFINVETLLHVANTTQTEFIHQDADINKELKFSHFVLKSTKPYVNQGVVAFYNARTYKLKPSDCLLMISAKYINPDLLHHSCVHMLQPSLIFSDRILATYFPDSVTKAANEPMKSIKAGEPIKSKSVTSEPIKSKVYQLGGMVHTNMAVITYHSIQSFEVYIKDVIHKKIKNGEPYERTVCYFMFQVLNAVLSAHDGSSLYTVKSVNLNDILLVEHPNAKSEPYLVINPLRSAEYERLDDDTLCNDLIQLIYTLLNLDPPDVSRGASRRIQGDTRFTSGMRRFVDVLEKRTFSCLLVARSIMEYLLWGPSDREMKSLLLAEDREQSFCIWLEVTRCKYVNELALGQLNRNLELSHMFHFLCAVTGSSLLDVTKLLYKGK